MSAVPEAVDIAHLRRWIGRQETASEVLSPELVRRFRATLELPGTTEAGQPAPELIHLCLAPPAVPMSELGPDGHPARGGFLPPVPLPRKPNADLVRVPGRLRGAVKETRAVFDRVRPDVVVGYGGYLHQRLPWLGARAYLAALAFAVLLGLSVLVHELAHAGAARAFGWQVREIRLTLMGGHTTFDAAREAPGRSALVSLAGPAANLVLALLGAILLGSLDPGGLPRLVVELVTTANLLVGAFNLLPGLPLDGGRVVESLVWAVTGSETRGTVVAAWCGRVISVLVVLWAQIILPKRERQQARREGDDRHDVLFHVRLPLRAGLPARPRGRASSSAARPGPPSSPGCWKPGGSPRRRAPSSA